jgi:hypothetical protein
MTRYLSSFGKGPQQCVGINLAYAEICRTLAAVFRIFGLWMQLCETGFERGVRVAHDVFVTAPRVGSKGIGAVVGKERLTVVG